MRGLKDRPRGWTEWLTTTDHKKIGILYLFATFFFFLLGGTEALIMRLQLFQANNTLITPEHYNALVTMHGTTMIFLFIVPVLAGFANYFVPLMIGARDMAFPRLNALSFWLLLFGGIAFYASVFFEPPQDGWTMYAPLSDDAFSAGGGTDAWIFLIHLTGLSSILGAINFVATIHNMRARRMGGGRPLCLDLPAPPPGLPLDSRRDHLRAHDPQHARPRHELGPHAALHLGRARVQLPADPGAAGDRGGGHDAAHRPPLRHRLLR